MKTGALGDSLGLPPPKGHISENTLRWFTYLLWDELYVKKILYLQLRPRGMSGVWLVIVFFTVEVFSYQIFMIQTRIILKFNDVFPLQGPKVHWCNFRKIRSV